MIGRIVITSVPQGLGGGSGFQPVLRTAGLRPSIAERLAMRAAYPHPHDFGNPDNPHVLFHRIETIGDRTIHILGSVRDAGSSYTGRSNYLAELIAIDRAETRSLPAGPVFAARAFPWLDHWSGETREIPLGEERAVPADDPADRDGTRRAQICTTWASLAGDAGWAGTLAQSFLDGCSAVIWVGKEDDAMSLFVEAARLLPLCDRWRVTFNSCEIEPFPAHWRARRSDLAVVGPRPAAQDLVLDLAMLRKTGERAPDTEVAQRARGEQPNQSTTQSRDPTDASGSRIVADDAALRAHLKEISDERKRRSVTSRVAVGGAAHWSPWQITTAIAAAGIILAAVLVMFVAVSAGLDPGATSRWLGASNSAPAIASLATELRSRTEQADQEERLRKMQAAEKAEEQAERERQKSEEFAEAYRKITKDRRHEEEKRKSDQVKQQIEAERRRLEQERLGREGLAIEQLEAKGGKNAVSLHSPVQLDPLESGNENPPPPIVLFRFKDCGFSDLIKPTIEVAHPYAKDEQIVVEDETQSTSRESTWLVKGSFYSRTSGNYEGPITIGRIRAQDNTFYLEPLLPSGHTLLSRLENTVLLISSRDPNTEVAKVRREIRLSEPIDSALHDLMLDPLGGDPPGSQATKGLSETIRKRIEGVDEASLDWSIELTHPALDHAAALRPGNEKVRLVLARPPEEGVAISYHQPKKDGIYEQRSVQLRLEVELEFAMEDRCFRCKPSLVFIGERGDDRAVLRNAFSLERLATLQRQSGDNSDDPGLRSLETAVLRELKTQHDIHLATLKNRRTMLAQQQIVVPQPGSTANPGVTPENTAAYAKIMTDFAGWISQVDAAINGRNQSNDDTYESDSKACIESLKPHRDWFGPIQIRVKACAVLAKLSRNGEPDEEFVVPIVAESPN